MKAFNKIISLLSVSLLLFSMPIFGQEEITSFDEKGYQEYLENRVPTKYTPNKVIVEIYDEVSNNPERYIEQGAEGTMRAVFKAYGYDKVIPKLKGAILSENHLTQVSNFFIILMEHDEGREIAGETALILLTGNDAQIPKQLVALQVIKDLGKKEHAPMLQSLLNHEDQRIRSKAAEALNQLQAGSDELDSNRKNPPAEDLTTVNVLNQNPSNILVPEAKEVTEVAPVEMPERSSQWLFWLIGALVVIGGLFVIVRRKN